MPAVDGGATSWPGGERGLSSQVEAPRTVYKSTSHLFSMWR
jgi:hypothetical protein